MIPRRPDRSGSRGHQVPAMPSRGSRRHSPCIPGRARRWMPPSVGARTTSGAGARPRDVEAAPPARACRTWSTAGGQERNRPRPATQHPGQFDQPVVQAGRCATQAYSFNPGGRLAGFPWRTGCSRQCRIIFAANPDRIRRSARKSSRRWADAPPRRGRPAPGSAPRHRPRIHLEIGVPADRGRPGSD